MIDISTTYMGLYLKNPLIIGSCGLTGSIDSIQKLAQNGAGAIVLKSLFEEQIMMAVKQSSNDLYTQHTEANDYLQYFERKNIVENYLKLIGQAKKSVSIPIIASINCQTDEEWPSFAKSIQEAGADALELNVFLLPSKIGNKYEITENMYLNIFKSVKKYVSIPVSLKISYHFTNLANTMYRFSKHDLDSLVLFNRFYHTDIDIDTEEVISGNAFSSEHEYLMPLRWIAMLSEDLDCDICASTGIHNGKAMVKQLLAGAKVVQMVSAIYEHKPSFIQDTLLSLKNWMTKKNYKSLSDFRGKLAQSKIDKPEFYERVQFMRYLDQVDSPY